MSKFPAVLASLLACLLFIPACKSEPAEPVIDDAYFELLDRHLKKVGRKSKELRYPLLSDTPWNDVEVFLDDLYQLADVRASELAPLRPSIPDSKKYTDSLKVREELDELRSNVRELLRLSVLTGDEKGFDKSKTHLETVEVRFNDASELCEIHKPVK